MIKTILFDLDGTLLDTAPDFTIVLNQLLEAHDHPSVSPKTIRKTVSDGARALIKLGFSIEEKNPNFPFLLRNLLELYDKQIPNTTCTLFEDIAPLLARIESENCQWGIVTNKPSRFTLPLIEMFSVLSSCSTVVCPDNVVTAKPDPEGLLLACQQTNSLPNETIYVGDHVRDIEAGINAKISTVAVEWGYLSDDASINTWKADKIVSTPKELQHYLFQQ